MNEIINNDSTCMSKYDVKQNNSVVACPWNKEDNLFNILRHWLLYKIEVCCNSFMLCALRFK